MTDAPHPAPTRPLAILRCLGPGLIVAGSIVGSGELIATTKTGAEAGFVLLWLILLGCVVKIFVQVELGRYAIISGQTTLRAINELPGPRFGRRGNWIVWYWVVMFIAGIAQLGGIIGGVGQAMAIAMPVTAAGRDAGAIADLRSQRMIDPTAVDASKIQQLSDQYNETHGDSHRPVDAAVWAAILAVGTAAMLVSGRYTLIQTLATAMVGAFTVLTLGNLFWLQQRPDFAITAAEFWSGLRGRLPTAVGDANPVGTALATFGLIGVGAAELVVYPYWCLEKGYGRFVGPRPDAADRAATEDWNDRARGWMRIMRIDAWAAMVVYTFATVAFYLLGAATLHRLQLNPQRDDMIRTLTVMYVPVFSAWASQIFLFGAFAVLYSTFFVANACHARTFADAMHVIGWIGSDETAYRRWVRRLSGVFPILCLIIFLYFPNPAKLVLISGVFQGLMLPMLAAAALYFRYRRCTEELRPGRLWDTMLWTSAAAMLTTGVWTVLNQLGVI